MKINHARHSFELQNLEQKYFQELKIFCDQEIGDNYYQVSDFDKILTYSKLGKLNASFVALNADHKIIGARLTYLPGEWAQKERGFTPLLWPYPATEVAYFKSLFINKDYQSLGIGSTLSKKSIAVIKEAGGKGIICHSWLESPGNSSQIYLKKMGFTEIKRHPKFWNPIDYRCPICQDQRCQCTAVEMFLDLARSK